MRPSLVGENVAGIGESDAGRHRANEAGNQACRVPLWRPAHGGGGKLGGLENQQQPIIMPAAL